MPIFHALTFSVCDSVTVTVLPDATIGSDSVGSSPLRVKWMVAPVVSVVTTMLRSVLYVPVPGLRDGVAIRQVYDAPANVSGTKRFAVVPSPSWEELLDPQAHTVPSAVTARLCALPAATSCTAGSADTKVGT